MARLKRLLRGHGDTLAFVLVVLALGYALNTIQQNNHDAVAAAQLDSCERGNRLRAVVWENTNNAARYNAGTPAGAVYEAQLEVLKATPFVRPDGTVDCEQALAGGPPREYRQQAHAAASD
jgi:hypothetical protein